MALARIYGPHRPDDYYGISLCLMVAGLLARYADRWTVPKEQAVRPPELSLSSFAANLRRVSVPS